MDLGKAGSLGEKCCIERDLLQRHSVRRSVVHMGWSCITCVELDKGSPITALSKKTCMLDSPNIET